MQQLAEDDNLLSGTVHRDVVVALKTRQYRQLASYLKNVISLAWSNLARGRIIYRVFWGDETVFLMSVDWQAKQVGAILDEQELSNALLDAGGVGEVTVDKFELRLARKLAERFGTRIQ